MVIANSQLSFEETITKRIWSLLEGVPDPEIPTISVVDLGIIERVAVNDVSIEIEILPTYSGCPALDWMRESIENAVHNLAEEHKRTLCVKINRSIPWSSDRISEIGREKLRATGFAPPPILGLMQLEDTFTLAEHVDCPHCGSSHTQLDSIFGPTACRAIYRCLDCKEPFEHFKPV